MPEALTDTSAYPPNPAAGIRRHVSAAEFAQAMLRGGGDVQRNRDGSATITPGPRMVFHLAPFTRSPSPSAAVAPRTVSAPRSREGRSTRRGRRTSRTSSRGDPEPSRAAADLTPIGAAMRWVVEAAVANVRRAAGGERARRGR